ncbi:MinD/ParA family ATP-binding protein [Mycobacterium mantenii]|uniref:ATPase n=1 Tax=Mycobacterium mantenii TaxID=560555 RepID=A0A1A2T412_MYCNT|nr:MinD/ParA family protein [Mycobacterium mantenii]OBH40430.1 ATPase [Mycobacterium mantenii]OBH51375.1 ATPase [Mycobacterium mantenii]OBH71193.1 ATPase [Mycobacterium mantenii]OBH76791.1 ATPase [Mycobacterium mantenii]
MTEHPTAGVGAPEQPTTQIPQQTSPAADQRDAAEPQAEPGGDAPTRAFAGFRTERRGPGPERQQAAPPTPGGMPPWDPTPMTGIPRVDPTAYGAYYTGPDAPPTEVHGPPPQQRPEHLPHTPYPELSTGMLLRPVAPPPSDGWRLLLFKLSGGLINLGESPRATRYNNLVAQVNRPLRGSYRVAFLSLKGGVGKTTIAATLGATFASIRGDRVVAVDANPDRGTLSQKIPLETAATVRQLLHDAGTIERYSDVRRYTSKGPSGLEVLASETDPAISDAFSAEDYARILDILERFYGLVLTDCGPGLLHSVMSSVLDKADALVVVSSASIDGARSASATLDWLDAHGHEDLVRNSIAVINGVKPRPGKVDMNKVVDHFSRRCRAVQLVPFDPHLEEGAEIDLDRLRRRTREALTELAAIVADGFPGDQHNPGVLG